MRSYLPRFTLRAPRSLDETLALLAAEPGRWRPLAGGTDVMVTLDSGTLTHTDFLSIRHLRELRAIALDDDSVTIGALVTYTDLRRHAALRAEWPLLCDAAAHTGGIATQNRGTIGGNIANASPAADTPPVLLVYDAEIEVTSLRGTRRLSYDRFHSGYKTVDMAADELITAIRLPRRRPGWIEMFRKVGTRRAQAISKICLAAAVRVEQGLLADVRLGFGSVAPTVVRATTAEDALRGRAPGSVAAADIARALTADLHPIDDIRSTAVYRSSVARNLLTGWIATLAARPGNTAP